MVNAINKYSWEDWKHEIIDTCDSLEEANRLEQYYIEMYKSNDSKYGYNITKGGFGHSGQPMKQETKDKLSAISKEKWKDPIYRESVISKHRGKKLSDAHRLKISLANTGKEFSEETRTKISEKLSIPILQFDLEGNLLLEFPSIKNAGEILNVSSSSIHSVCIGKTLSCKNSIFMYKSEY